MDLRRRRERVRRKPEPRLTACSAASCRTCTPPKAALLPQLGPSISFPVAGLWRDATTASLPGVGGTDQDTRKWLTAWEGKDDEIGIKGPPYRKLGVDAQWENCLVVYDGAGNIIETWKQWDKIFRRPHSVYISPYDMQKRVWVVDDNMQAIYIFTHDGKQLAADDRHAGAGRRRCDALQPADVSSTGCPTARSSSPTATRARASRSSTRTASSCSQWGIKGVPPNEKRPGYMNNVHGVAVDPVNRHVFVNDRNNHRIQVFDENGKFLSEWRINADPSSLHLLYIGQDRNVWTFDRSTNKMVKYDQQGHLLYAWGAMGNFPGGLWGVHGMSVDSGRQPVRRRSRQRARPEVQAAAGRESGIPRRQAGQAGLDELRREVVVEHTRAAGLRSAARSRRQSDVAIRSSRPCSRSSSRIVTAADGKPPRHPLVPVLLLSLGPRGQRPPDFPSRATSPASTSRFRCGCGRGWRSPGCRCIPGVTAAGRSRDAAAPPAARLRAPRARLALKRRRSSPGTSPRLPAIGGRAGTRPRSCCEFRRGAARRARIRATVAGTLLSRASAMTALPLDHQFCGQRVHGRRLRLPGGPQQVRAQRPGKRARTRSCISRVTLAT